MRNRRATLTWALVLILTAFAVAAQDPDTEYIAESERLESDLDQYLEARERERQSIGELREIARLLDETLADPHAPVATMRDLEASFKAAREATVRRLEDTSQARLRMYDRMDRLFALAADLEQSEPDAVDPEEEGANGLWQFQFKGADISALVDLDFSPSGLDRSFTVNGHYRTSNGHSGTVLGTFFGTRLALEVLDSRRGKVAELDGAVGGDGRLQGTWRLVETGLGRDERRQGGLWSGHRVSSSTTFDSD